MSTGEQRATLRSASLASTHLLIHTTPTAFNSKPPISSQGHRSLLQSRLASRFQANQRLASFHATTGSSPTLIHSHACCNRSRTPARKRTETNSRGRTLATPHGETFRRWLGRRWAHKSAQCSGSCPSAFSANTSSCCQQATTTLEILSCLSAQTSCRWSASTSSDLRVSGSG